MRSSSRELLFSITILCALAFCPCLAEVGASLTTAPNSDLNEQAMRLFHEGKQLTANGQYAVALEKFRQAGALLDRIPSPESAAWMCAWSGDCLSELQRFPEALAARQECARRFIAIHGRADHADVASALNNLASCLQTMGRLREALPIYQDALAMTQRLNPGDHPDVGNSLNNLAYCLQLIGRSQEALPIYEQSLAMRQRLFAGDHTAVSRSLNNLAYCLQSLGRTAEALSFYEQALAMRRRLVTGDDDELATEIGNIAFCLDGLGRLDEALPKYQESLAMLRRIYPRDHWVVATGMNNVAHCFQALGRSTEALPIYEQSLLMTQRIFSGDHPDVANSINNKANCLESLGREPEALILYEQSLAMYQRLFPGDHPHVATNLNNVGNALQILGRPVEGLAKCEQALAMHQRTLPADHPYIARDLNTVAFVLHSMGRNADAAHRYQEALAIYQRIFPGPHPEVAVTLNNVGFMLQTLNRLPEALPMYQQALDMRRAIFKGDHPDVIQSLNNVACCLDLLGRKDEARRTYEEALAMIQRTGYSHLFSAPVNLARLYEELGRPQDAAVLLNESIAQIELLRQGARGLSEQDRSAYFETLKRSGAYESMVRTQMTMGRPDEALRFLERGRSRSLLDLLERSRVDPLAELSRRAAQQHDEEMRLRIEGVQNRLTAAEQRVTRLEHQTAALRGRLDAASQPATDTRRIDTLQTELKAARTEALDAGRAWFDLVKRILPMSRAREPLELQQMLSGNERLIVYSITDQDALLMLVPPTMGKIVGYPLTWPDGRKVNDRTLTSSVQDYLDALMREGYAAQRSQIQSRLDQLKTNPARGGEEKELRSVLSQLEARGIDLRAVTSQPADAVSSAEQGAKLFAALIPPQVWPQLQAADVVYLVPHGALNRLPMETLVTQRLPTTRYWLDDGPAIAYGSSGSVLLWSKARREDQRSQTASPPFEVIALGDPVFSRSSDSQPVIPEWGVTVWKVQEGSPAARAGLAPGDVLLSYAGVKLTDDRMLRRQIDDTEDAMRAGTRGNEPVMLQIWRAGKTQELKVAPGARLGIQVAGAPPGEALAKMDQNPADPRMFVAERSAYLSRYGGLTPLPGTRNEVLSIYRTLTGRTGEATDKSERSRGANGAVANSPRDVQMLLGEDATKTRLFDAAPQARFLHLATHQLADETQFASYSSLALTLPAKPTAADNGFLRLVDLLENWRDRISNCELVVLSACETQRGQLQRDEGVFALPWGFMYAGAPCVIASLWNVNDASTAELMSEMYRRLEENRAAQASASANPGPLTKLAAFTAARKKLRDNPQYAAPYFWAPFIFIGNPQ